MEASAALYAGTLLVTASTGFPHACMPQRVRRFERETLKRVQGTVQSKHPPVCRIRVTDGVLCPTVVVDCDSRQLLHPGGTNAVHCPDGRRSLPNALHEQLFRYNIEGGWEDVKGKVK